MNNNTQASQQVPSGMTEQQIRDLAEEFKGEYRHGGVTFDTFDYMGFAAALLAQSAPAAPAAIDVRDAALRAVKLNHTWMLNHGPVSYRDSDLFKINTQMIATLQSPPTNREGACS